MISSTLLIKSSVSLLSDTPSTVSNANKVLLQNTGATAEVIIKSDDTFQSGSAAVQGSFLLMQGHELIIKKDRLFTLEVGSGITTVFATSVGVEG